MASGNFPRLLRRCHLLSPSHQCAPLRPLSVRPGRLHHATCYLKTSPKPAEHSGFWFLPSCTACCGPSLLLGVGDPMRNKRRSCPQVAHIEWGDTAEAAACVFYTFLWKGCAELSLTTQDVCVLAFWGSCPLSPPQIISLGKALPFSFSIYEIPIFTGEREFPNSPAQAFIHSPFIHSFIRTNVC